MRIIDIIKTAQQNLVRAKLRTFLTILAVFVGALTISLTNGVGSGVKDYVDRQLGNVGAEDTLIITAKNPGQNPVAGEVREYEPDKQVGTFNQVLVTKEDIPTIEAFEGVLEVTPYYWTTLEYITVGEKKYQATASQYTDGMNVELTAGELIAKDSPDGIMIPSRYIEPLGFSSDQAAIGESLTVGVKTLDGEIAEVTGTIVGVQEASLLGNGDMNLSPALSRELVRVQTEAFPQQLDQYFAFTVTYDTSFDEARVQELKDKFDEAGFQAQTVQDQIGTVYTVINTILIGLNIFGAIALLAASFGIVNTLLMAVGERTREIGLMKALGMHRRGIFAIFAIEAVSLGFWGALLGILVSIGAGQIINNVASDTFLKDFTGFNLLEFPLLPSLGILGLIMLIAFIAGALPSLKASRLDPIAALRSE